MSTRIFVTSSVILLAFLLGAADAHAQQNEPKCQAVLKARDADLAKNTTEQFCTALAGLIITELSQPEAKEILKTILKPDVARVFSPRDMQNRSANQPELGGSIAQGQAVPGVQPAGVAAGSIAAVGTNAGRETIAALTFNPAVLFLAERASAQLARAARLADLTVFVPVSNAPEGDITTVTSSSKLRYVGVRARVNITGVTDGTRLWREADALLEKRIARLATSTEHLFGLLVHTSDVEGCTAALLDTRTADAVSDACGAPFGYTADIKEAQQIHDEFSKVRRAADRRYFGVDLRFDTGDPTLGAVANASGDFTFVGLAFGQRIGAETASGISSGIRVRLGVRHAKLDSQSKADITTDFAAGWEMRRAMADEEELTLSAGVEWRQASDTPALDAFQATKMIRASMSIPLVKGAGVSLNLAKPLDSGGSPIITVSFNWGLLLSDRPGR